MKFSYHRPGNAIFEFLCNDEQVLRTADLLEASSEEYPEKVKSISSHSGQIFVKISEDIKADQFGDILQEVYDEKFENNEYKEVDVEVGEDDFGTVINAPVSIGDEEDWIETGGLTLRINGDRTFEYPTTLDFPTYAVANYLDSNLDHR